MNCCYECKYCVYNTFTKTYYCINEDTHDEDDFLDYNDIFTDSLKCPDFKG
jgi:hypothetical protein